ncbi:MAG: glycosyl hydrolase, partial [Eudoraea sp.]
PKVVPNTYKVKLLVGKEEYIREVAVLKDPISEGTIEEIKEQVAFSLELRDAINLAVSMINDIEAIRSELNDIIPKLTNQEDIQKATQLQEVSESIVGILYDIQLTGAREDAFRAPMRLYGRLSALASDITGNGVDFKPTDQQQEVFTIFNERLEKVNKRFTEFMELEVKKLNTQLKRSKMQIDLDRKIKS